MEIYIQTYKPSPKSWCLFFRINKRRYELEVNWVFTYIPRIILHTGIKGGFSRKLF